MSCTVAVFAASVFGICFGAFAGALTMAIACAASKDGERNPNYREPRGTS